MSIISQKITPLTNGVSQQADSAKLVGQFRSCTNFTPDPTVGLAKRPGMRAIGELTGAAADGSWFMAIRDDQERYIIQFSKAGVLKMWDAESGQAQIVNTQSAGSLTYATHINSSDLGILQVNDYYFVLNRKKIVAASSSSSPTTPYYAFVLINTLASSTRYAVILNSTEYAFTSPGTVTGAILKVGAVTGGSSYTNGVYTGVTLTGGSGTGAKGTVVIAGNVVTSISITSPGQGYLATNVLVPLTAEVGGTGSGASTTVSDIGIANAPINLSDVTEGLKTAINAGGVWTATTVSNVLYIVKNDATDFNISAKGGTTNNSLEAYKGTVPSSSVLPRQFKHNAVIRVNASDDSEGDDYYLKFVTSNGGSFGAGIWEETIGSNVLLGLDPDFMPHAIIREANGTFSYRSLNEASAAATVTSTTTTGIPSVVAITTTGAGTYVVGETFSVTGGAGRNLRLRVTAVGDSDSIDDNPIDPLATAYTFVYKFVSSAGKITYRWVVEGEGQINETDTDDSFSLGNKTYSVYPYEWFLRTVIGIPEGTISTFVAGLRIVTHLVNTIQTVDIIRAGQGYAASNIVTDPKGATFTISSVVSKTTYVDDIGKNFWQERQVGDLTTNPNPSFVGKTITGLSFFKNRLVFLSDDNVICSQAGSYFDFFATTVITIVNSDPVDISCGSTKPIELRHAVQLSRALLVCADNAQYLLETSTEAFSASTAEINLISNYSQDIFVAPVDAGTTVMVLDQNTRYTSIYEMLIQDAASKPLVANISTTIPSYIPGNIIAMKGSTASSMLSIQSSQKPDELFFFRWFNATGNERTMASWFKWTLPGDLLLHEHDNESMFFVTKQPNPFLSKMVSLSDSSNGAMTFDDTYIDLRMDLYNYSPATSYDSGTNQTKVFFKAGIAAISDTPVLVSTDPVSPGLSYELPLQSNLGAAAGQQYYVLINGNRAAESWCLGVRVRAEATLPKFYYKAENRADTLNIPTIQRLFVESKESGPFSVSVKAEGRDEFVQEIAHMRSNDYFFNTLPMIRSTEDAVPIMAKGTQVDVTLRADYPLPVSLTSITWQGRYTTKGVTRQ
jgi:hypothetical protein